MLAVRPHPGITGDRLNGLIFGELAQCPKSGPFACGSGISIGWQLF
jgi:hypothetical protein